MDFDKTSFCVDLYTPGDKYAPKRLSFPKSARMSIDDFVADSPLSFCFGPVDRAYDLVDTAFDAARGWTHGAFDLMYDQEQDQQEEAKKSEEGKRALLAVAYDCAACGVDLDASCLDGLDEQLLVSPLACFSEVCWADAVCDEWATTPPVDAKHGRSGSGSRARSRSFKRDDGAFAAPFKAATEMERGYPGSFERSRPLAARIALPLDVAPHYLGARAPHAMSLMFDKPLPLPCVPPKSEPSVLLPVQGIPMARRITTKRDQALTPLRSPSTPASAKSGHTLRVISDAFTRRRKTPQAQ